MNFMLTRKKCALSLAASLLTFSSLAMANDFNLPFINVSGLGNAFSDWATEANDASTSYANPAGLVNIKHQQMVVPVIGLLGNANFKGVTTTPPYPFPGQIQLSGKANTHLAGFFPSFYYAYPLSDRYVAGFGLTVPFALGTVYSTDSVVKYLSTRTQILVFSAGPSIGAKILDNLSVGAGVDVVRIAFTISSMFGPPLATPDVLGQNRFIGWGVGWHIGGLYQFLPTSRIGINYFGRIATHATGRTAVFNPPPLGRVKNHNNGSSGALPARAQLSLHHDFNSQWSIMSTIFYTNWRTFEKVTMKRTLLPGTLGITSVTIPFNYHNTFDYALGLSYKPTPEWTLRTGAQYMNTPSNNQDRGVANPIGRMVVANIGAHYQQNACLGYDIAFAHSFFKEEPVNLTTPLTSAVGRNYTQANTFGAQVTWDIA